MKEKVMKFAPVSIHGVQLPFMGIGGVGGSAPGDNPAENDLGTRKVREDMRGDNLSIGPQPLPYESHAIGDVEISTLYHGQGSENNGSGISVGPVDPDYGSEGLPVPPSYGMYL